IVGGQGQGPDVSRGERLADFGEPLRPLFEEADDQHVWTAGRHPVHAPTPPRTGSTLTPRPYNEHYLPEAYLLLLRTSFRAREEGNGGAGVGLADGRVGNAGWRCQGMRGPGQDVADLGGGQPGVLLQQEGDDAGDLGGGERAAGEEVIGVGRSRGDDVDRRRRQGRGGSL